MAVKWLGRTDVDDFGLPIRFFLYDAKTTNGQWALMGCKSWALYGCHKLGIGFGQKYQRQPNGEFHKIEG